MSHPALLPAPSPATRRVLELCARPRLGDAEGELRELNGADLNGLADAAAHQRIAPLAWAHLRAVGCDHPELRRLKGYVLRERVQAERREAVLRRALTALADTPVVLLKGAALARTLYAAVEDRSMDDLDLWVSPAEVASARERLLAAGFSGPPAGGEHEREHHAAPVELDGVSVELHRHFPASGRAERWDDVLPHTEDAPGLDGARVPCRAHLVWQVWHHAFRSSLRWTPWRLVWVADLVGLLAAGDVDWNLTGPMPGLAHLDEITPLPDAARAALGVPSRRLAARGTRYDAWPRARRLSYAAFSPPPWWLRLRHGVRGEALWRCRLEHLRDLRAERRAPWTGPPSLKDA